MRLLSACLFALVAVPAAAQPLGTISTVAGGGVGDGGPALSATLKAPLGVALGADGVIYVADSGQGRVRKIAADGTITTLFVGTQSFNYSTFPIYQNTNWSCPTDLLVDTGGNVIFSDPCSHVVRKIDTTGAVSVIAGRGTHVTPFDDPLNEGPATSASLVFPTHIALDSAGNLYITEPGRHRIRKVTSDGIIHHFTGANSFSEWTNFWGPVAVDASGALHAYVASGFNAQALPHRILRFSAEGIGTVVAGNGASTDSGDGGPATAAGLSQVQGMAFDAAGNLLLAMADRVRRITPAGTIETVATPGGADVSPEGSAFIVPSGDRVLRVTAPASTSAVAGLAPGVEPSKGDGGPAIAARLQEPSAVVVDANGNVYVADRGRHEVRKVDSAGTITTIAGTGAAGFSGDGGPAAEAQLSGPAGLAVDGSGRLYIADQDNHRVRRIDNAGIITTVAGTGSRGFSGDGGAAVAAQLDTPMSVDVDEAGSLVIADYGNGRIRRVAASGEIQTLGGGGTIWVNYYASPTPALSAALSAWGVKAAGGRIYVAYGPGSRDVVAIDADGMVRPVVGNVSYPNTYSWPPTRSVEGILAIERDAEGRLIILDDRGGRVIRGAEGNPSFTVLAGDATCMPEGCPQDGIGDGGPANAAFFGAPSGMFLHAASGYLYVVDERQQRVRKLQASLPMPSAFTIPEVTDAALSTAVVSAPVTPTGYMGPTSISVVGGEYSIGCTGIFTAAAASISPGQSVCVRLDTAHTYNTRRFLVLTIGGRTAEWIVTTMTGPGSASLSTSSVAFPEQLVNTQSAPIMVTVANTGSNEIMLGSWVASPGITVARECSPIIPAGATCQLAVTLTPPAVGAYSGVVTLRLSIGFMSLDVTGSGTRSLAAHFYRSILDREPEPEGVTFWDGEAARAQSQGADPREAWYAMAASFFSSPEYISFNRTDDEFVSNLYRTFFDRLPDAGGLEYWKGQLAAGLPREMLVTGFTFSPEFTNFTRVIFGEVSVRPEVTLVMDLYRGFLSRLPDNDGLAFWAGRLRTVQCSGATWSTKLDLMRAEVEDMTKGFLDSAEYSNRNRSDAQFLADTYAALFRRAADVAGFDYWKARLAGGETRHQVRAAMIGMSQEYLIRVSAAAASPCMS